MTRLIQIVANLLNNAAKYTPEGGRITLTASEKNRQAVITSLPLPESRLAEEGCQPPAPKTGPNVLVVDDNLDSAESLATMLALMGCETHTAHDGIEAVKAAQAFQPDVVMLDIGLPLLTDHEVARRIRAQPWGRVMTLIALTGWGQEEDRRKLH